MDVLFWVVTIGLFAYLVYAMFTAPPSSGCLSADLARALDEKRNAEASRRGRRAPQEGLSEPTPAEPAPPAVAMTEPAAAMPIESPDGATSDSLRNPLTGEAAAVPTNYRFAKRWIKEAMVAEGLLDKVYGTTELDAEVSEKVRTALAQFKQLAKYRA